MDNMHLEIRRYMCKEVDKVLKSDYIVYIANNTKFDIHKMRYQYPNLCTAFPSIALVRGDVIVKTMKKWEQ